MPTGERRRFRRLSCGLVSATGLSICSSMTPRSSRLRFAQRVSTCWVFQEGALADRLLGVELAGEAAAELHVELLTDFGQAVLVDEREDAELHRRHFRVELQVHRARA